ncbi:hypothetical protein NH340_JMT00809 [Sarcoptes scabiei]|nr:hypothetical protein NH340_JMT00809 [Sarcoptes scabiei]
MEYKEPDRKIGLSNQNPPIIFWDEWQLTYSHIHITLNPIYLVQKYSSNIPEDVDDDRGLKSIYLDSNRAFSSSILSALPSPTQASLTTNNLFDLVIRTTSIFALQVGPLFWIAFLIRIKCLTSMFRGDFLRRFHVNDISEDGSDYYDEDGGEIFGDFQSPLLRAIAPSRQTLLRISLVIGFTAILLQRSSINYWFLLAQYQWSLRTLQIYLCPLLYVAASRTFHEDL